MEKGTYASYIEILRHELVPALGCTEPIAIAFASAKARDALGRFPEHLTAHLSGNIIKNVKSVIVPNSGGQRGIEAAATLGCVGGDASLSYEVLRPVTAEHIARTRELVGAGFCDAKYVEGKDNLYIRIEASAGDENASVTVEHEHTNITSIEKNGVEIFKKNSEASAEAIDRSALSVRGIWDFAAGLDVEDVKPMLSRQIELNTAISDEGLKGGYGAEVGKLLMTAEGEKVEGRAAARAAAGSDARMNGCSMPVVINSGSGNQGMTVALPVFEYARTWERGEDQLFRALAFSNLLAVHIKRHIGNLSAFCGAVSAACGAAAGIAYLDSCSYEQICMTITNTLCNVGGIVCDGAKSSCAAKIASAVNAGTLSYRMAKNGKTFCVGDGLVGRDIEETIENVGRMGRDGMKSTDIEILNVMVGN
ncbi:MAG: serine dehydratase subunit alpha family protein [Clostridiales bacterium]|nr:serine dehydratase subunit alpha family protein [Clostridiales bacterium]